MFEENYENACRLCLNTNSKNINVFDNNSYAEIITTISTSLSIQLTQNDDFPKCLCTVCIEKVVSWDSFRKLCTESQEQLYQWRERKLQKQREEEANANSTFSRLETSIHIKEEFLDDDFDDSFEYTYETFTPEFSIKFEPRSETENYQHSERRITPKKSPATDPAPSRIPFNLKLVIEMYKDNVCKFCSKKFIRNSNLVQHLRLFHMIVPMHTCFCCGKSYKSKLEVQTHRSICKRKSLQNSSYSDGIEKDEVLKDPLNINEKQIESTPTDSSDYKFSCSLCGNLFKTIEEWTLHRSTHVDKLNESFSNYDATKNLEPITTETSLDQSFSEALNDVQIQDVRSESVDTFSSTLSQKYSTDTILKPIKKKSKSKKKLRPKFNFKVNGYYHCDCGRKFDRSQALSSHRKSHLRRGEIFTLKSMHKKSKDEMSEEIGDNFKCNGCNKIFLLASKFRFHKKHCSAHKELLSQNGKKESEITEDESQDNSNVKIESEQLNTTDDRDPKECSFCKRILDSKHRRLKHENQCLKRPSDLKKFMKIHPNGVKCGGCGKCYMSKSNYLKHRKTCSNPVLIEAKLKDIGDDDQSSANSLGCFLCNRTFLSPGACTEHKKRCYFQRTSTCIQCKQAFGSYIAFRTHYGQHHDRKTLRKLKKLNKLNKLEDPLRRLNQVNKPSTNIPSTQTNNSLTCKKCKKVLKTQKGYNYHMKTHSKHLCPNCNKYFYHSNHLTQHLEVCQKNSSENHNFVEEQDPLDITTPSPSSSKMVANIAVPNIAAPCAVCRMSFSNISELREHILMKHKPKFIQERKKKTYFCQFCKMAFDRHSDLKLHFNEYHAGNIKSEYPSPPVLKAEELFDSDNPICSLCQLTFDTRDELYMHENTHHNMEM